MMTISRAMLAVLVLTAAAASAAARDYSYPYGGVGYGHLVAQPNDSREILDHEVSTEIPFGQDTFTAFGGYRFGRHAAVELELGYGPESTARVKIDDREHKAVLRYWTAGASVVGLLPVNPRTDLYARAGLLRWAVSLGRVDRPERKKGLGVMFGLGAQAQAWDRSSLGIELRLTPFDKDEVGVDWARSLMVRVLFH